jgi:hypothetical protein
VVVSRRAVLATGAGMGVLVAVLVGAAGLPTPSGAVAAPRCFGAAARDSAHPCTNTSRSVVPTVAERNRVTRSGCRKTERAAGVDCEFGSTDARPARTFALIGDSHALGWRGALAVAARAAHWRGYSLWSPACLLSTAARYLDPIVRPGCERFNRDARRFLSRHPEISTVFVTHATYIAIFPPPGRTVLQAKVAGFTAAWATLPKSVKHIVVIRDNPGTPDATFDCVARVVAARTGSPGTACREDRDAVLPPDAAMTAVRLAHTRRVQSIDLTPYFCDQRYCFPVVGGVLVDRDFSHLSIAYARSLGPYLLRAIKRLAAHWST